ncbi:MAG: flotillin family protein [Myxococcales bacterium]|nr:flotillin family protein [Myxococcales bacterium]
MVALLIVASVLSCLVFVVLLGIRYIPNDRVGIIEKRFSFRGSVDSGLIARSGEAGYQPHVLRGGLHWLMPIQYSVRRVPLVTIPQGHIGYVFARDGRPLAPTQTLGEGHPPADFQDVEAFLAGGGQRGPQRHILREGTYALNLAQFLVVTDGALFYVPLDKSEDASFRQMAATIAQRHGFEPVIIATGGPQGDLLGVVTVHDGPSLADGKIIAPVVGDDPSEASTYHNKFQDAERFLAAGGQRGRQLQVLVDGTYFINRLFATVELIEKTIVEVGTVGVVVSYTGELGLDLSGNDYSHGELVANGTRGVWTVPLLPGKYAFNTYAGKIIMVPTTNFILKWTKGEIGSHRYDENLAEVSLITRDAFEPSLPLSVVVHIDYRKAPLVIQRFGDIKRLVEQTLDPMVAAYFKNVAQTRTLIELLQERSKIQDQASREMKDKFLHYNLELEEVLIGTPASAKGDGAIQTILTQLRSRQIAEEQIETFGRMERAAAKERDLREAEARARQQTQLTESELAIQVQSNEGRAAYQRSLQEAEQIKVLAEADAAKIRSIAEAEAERETRVGIARAIATDEQVRAYGGPRYQVIQDVMARFASAVAEAKVDVVPRVVVGSQQGEGGSTPNLMEGLLAVLLSDKLENSGHVAGASRPEADVMKTHLREAASRPANGKASL